MGADAQRVNRRLRYSVEARSDLGEIAFEIDNRTASAMPEMRLPTSYRNIVESWHICPAHWGLYDRSYEPTLEAPRFEATSSFSAISTMQSRL